MADRERLAAHQLHGGIDHLADRFSGKHFTCDAFVDDVGARFAQPRSAIHHAARGKGAYA